MGSESTVLLIYPESWLERRRKEWAPLAAAASAAGFQAFVTHWDALAVADGAVSARECLVRRRARDDLIPEHDVHFSPDVLLTTWGVGWENQALFDEIVALSGCVHSESALLGWLDGKCELELCLRSYEARTGWSIPRPYTVVSEEICAEHRSSDEELVIMKPSRSGQCKGIDIVPRSAVAALADEAVTGARAPFVVQDLISDVFLYEGRRWDIRVHAMATSLSPLRYRVYRDGVAKTAGVASEPGSGRLEEWLNAESHLEGVMPAENLSVTEMLRYVEREYHRLPDFWARVEALVGDVFASIALYAEQWPHPPGRSFLFAGFDLIVERNGERDYELRLLELNSHPGLGWEPRITALLAPQFRAWFADLRELVAGMQ